MPPMFTFDTPTTVTLSHVNLRQEKHGEESAAAIDVKFVRVHGNSQLALLHSDLRDAFYYRADTTEAQREIASVEPVTPNLRFPKMLPFGWELEMTGATVEIDYGLGEGSNVVLSDCKVNAFRVECKEGGTTEITFRVQTSNFPAGALDKLAGKLGQETAITLWAPEVKDDPVQGALDVAPPAAPAKKRGRAANERTPEEALAATRD